MLFVLSFILSEMLFVVEYGLRWLECDLMGLIVLNKMKFRDGGRRVIMDCKFKKVKMLSKIFLK